jgi:hypothetical protein
MGLKIMTASNLSRVTMQRTNLAGRRGMRHAEKHEKKTRLEKI